MTLKETYRASRSDSRRARMSLSLTGPLTFRMIDRLDSSMNSTRTWVTPPRDPVRPRTWMLVCAISVNEWLWHGMACHSWMGRCRHWRKYAGNPNVLIVPPQMWAFVEIRSTSNLVDNAARFSCLLQDALLHPLPLLPESWGRHSTRLKATF